MVKVVGPATWPPDGGSFEVRVEAEGVEDLAAFEFRLAFDPVILGYEGVEAGGFLASTGLQVTCTGGDLGPPQHDIFFFACSASGGEAPGPSGSGVLATARFHPLASGPSPLRLSGVKLTDTLGESIAADVQLATMTVGRSAETRIQRPAQAVPTPMSAPPRSGSGAVELVVGCSPVASGYAGGTAVQTVAHAVRPAGVLVSLWEFDRGIWRGYSPAFPEVSDLTETGAANVLLACVSGAGEFVRPEM